MKEASLLSCAECQNAFEGNAFQHSRAGMITMAVRRKKGSFASFMCRMSKRIRRERVSTFAGRDDYGGWEEKRKLCFHRVPNVKTHSKGTRFNIRGPG